MESSHPNEGSTPLRKPVGCLSEAYTEPYKSPWRPNINHNDTLMKPVSARPHSHPSIGTQTLTHPASHPPAQPRARKWESEPSHPPVWSGIWVLRLSLHFVCVCVCGCVCVCVCGCVCVCKDPAVDRHSLFQTILGLLGGGDGGRWGYTP